MRDPGRLGRIIIVVFFAAWTWWAAEMDLKPKTGFPVRAQRIAVAFAGWYLVWGLWQRLYGRKDPTFSESAAYRATRYLEHERREGRIQTPTGRISGPSETLERLRTPTGKAGRG